MDPICGNKFWDPDSSWYTNEPDFTDCFKKTVLVWIPCGFLWLFCPLEIYLTSNTVERTAPRIWLLSTKLGLTLLVIFLSVIELGLAIYTLPRDKSYAVEYFTPSLEIFSFSLAAVLMLSNKKYGRRNSGPIFTFWLLFVICGCFRFASTLKKVFAKDESTYGNISYIVYYFIVCIVCFLNFFAEGKPQPTLKKSPVEQTSPLEYYSLPSNWFYVPFDTLAWNGYKKPLEQGDLWSMNYEDTARGTATTFEKYWQESMHKTKSYPRRKTSFGEALGKMDLSHLEEKRTASIIPVLWKSFRFPILSGAFFKLAESISLFIGPQILRLLLGFISGDAPMWKGYWYTGLLLAVKTLGTLFGTQHIEYMRTSSLRIRTTVVGAIYRKSLRIANGGQRETTVGEIVNLMSVDVDALMNFVESLHNLWSCPMEIAISLYFLQNMLGPSVYAGIGVIVVIILLQAILSKWLISMKTQHMAKKDSRLKLIQEIINGIRVLKLYAWEPIFERRVSKIRREEIHVLRNCAYGSALMIFVWMWSPIVVCLVAFTTYVLIDESHILDAENVFVSLVLFNLIQAPMTHFPDHIVCLIQTLVSTRRLNKFMNADEVDPESVQHDSTELHPLIIDNGTFSRTMDKSVEPMLKNINIEVKKNQLVGIVGSVGSGKSSLLSAFLGEIYRLSGRVNTKGTIAYVSQQAWIQNTSVRNNILFGSAFEQDLYERVVDGCALRPDLAVLPAGDRTEIGEKGVNLSGGQKQRVSLARAIYSGADVYLFDDPLSAVDAHVGRHIFDHVIGPNGMLKEKTRVLVTHSTCYLPEMDRIFVLVNGEMKESGTYADLLRKSGAFSELLIHHLRQEATNESKELDNIKHQVESKENGISSSAERGIQSDIRQRSSSFIRNGNSPVDVAVEFQGKTNCIESENVETGVVKWKIYNYYLRATGWFLLMIGTIARALFETCGIGGNMWLTIWTEDNSTVIDGNVNIAKRNVYIGVLAAFAAGQGISVLTALTALTIGWIRSARLLHEKLLYTIMRVPVGFFDVTPSGRILNRFGKDMDSVDNILPRYLKIGLFSVMTVFGTIVVIGYETPILILFVVPMAGAYYFIQRVYLASCRQLMRLQSVSRSPILSYSSESIAGVSSIRAYRAQSRFISESERRVDTNQVCAYSAIIADLWLTTRLSFLGNLIIFFIALLAVLGKDTLSAGLVGLTVTYGLQLTNRLQWVVRATTELESNIVSVERIKEYDELPHEASWTVAENTPAKEWPQEGRIEFRDYKLRYRKDSSLALRGLTFEVMGGEKVGIVGRTGVGKSSLALGLFRIIEGAGGKILIDNVDISKIGLHDLRSKLTIIPQDPLLISGTLRMNLDPHDLHTDEELWTVLEQTRLKNFIRGLTDGLGYEIAENGDNLSVGQRQLICLARAILRKSKILVLDEATASVDVDTDHFIQQTIRREFENCTVLTIAHRLDTIFDSDKIIVLDNGCLAEFDSPENLLRIKTSKFHAMAKDAGLIA